MNQLIVLIIFILASILGFVSGWLYSHKTVGTLKIDRSDPKKDRYQFEIPDLDILDKKTKISLRVDHDADLSQK